MGGVLPGGKQAEEEEAVGREKEDPGEKVDK